MAADPGVSRAWAQLPGTPVAPGGGRAPDGRQGHAGVTSMELWALARMVEERLGLHFPPARMHLLHHGLAARKRVLGCRSTIEYHHYLIKKPAEWLSLASELTVGETSFFRQPEVYQSLAEEILPEIVEAQARSGSTRLRFWSAGCSTGEEAYSLTISALEALQAPWLWDLSVLGTDLDPAAIDAARAGRYDRSRTRAVSQQRLNTYFEKPSDSRTISVANRIRTYTTFREHNLAGTSWPLPGYDVILCQNVLLYLVPALRAPLLQRLYASLSEGGYLIVGPAELPGAPLPGGARPIRRGKILVYHRS